MPKKTLYHIIEWSVALAACAFLIYKIATYGDYPAMGETLRAMSWPQWLAIVLCIALMPVNMAIEAWRWKTLLPMPFIEARRQVYYSKLAGLITPWRLGEYPARGVLMSEGEPDVWSKVLSMGVVGGATMTAAIVLAGAVALAFSPAVLPYLGGSYLYALAAVVLLLAIAFALMPKAFRRFAEVNPSLLLRSLAQSLVRLLCWCVQLALVLYALGAITNLLVYYLLVTITPNVPIAEVGIRGAWAIVLFGSMNAAMAGVLLWIINTLLPCLIWPFLRKNTK
ncbi:MAG: flippase-like domain-containing protein [Paludibacteraceae bacterium]|nr:flippase-like domain-containing protein [Paludibacteraceae bacterium]